MIRSVKLATQVQNIFCSCKLIAVAIIIGGGVYKLCEGSYDHVSTGFKVNDDCDVRGILEMFDNPPGHQLGGRQTSYSLLLRALGLRRVE